MHCLEIRRSRKLNVSARNGTGFGYASHGVPVRFRCLEIRRSGKAWFSLTRGVPFSQPRQISLLTVLDLLVKMYLFIAQVHQADFRTDKVRGARYEVSTSEAKRTTVPSVKKIQEVVGVS